MLWKKSRALITDLHGLIELCESGLKDFDTALEIFYTDGCNDEFIAASDKVKEWEDKADKQVFHIKNSMYGNFLLPESREDIARLLNKVDNIIDNAMHTVKYIALRNLNAVPELSENIIELREGTKRCFSIFKDTLQILFQARQSENVRSGIEEIGQFESICDDVQNRVVAHLYHLPIDDVDRILQSELVAHIGSVSDACEDAASVMGIINLKRAI